VAEPFDIFIMNQIPILPFTKDMTGAAGYLAAASSMSYQSLTKLRREAHQFFRWIWHNKDEGCSPAQMLAAMGTNAKKNFELHALVIQLILKSGLVIPASEFTPPLPYTIHPDGTITLN
jgi:hypothetical protein